MPIDRPIVPPQPTDPGTLLHSVAVPLLQLGPDGLVQWLNAAAAQALQAQPGQPLATLWAPGAAIDTLCTPAGGPVELQAAPGAWFRVHSAPLGAEGWLLTLEPATELHTARAEVDHLAELLDLARDFGRLGVWERDVRTMRGQWDRQVLRFWGLDPNQPTPDFAQATQNILEADRKALGPVFRDSVKQAGRYSARYRVRAFDGTVRRIHSQWLVKNGPDGEPDRVLGLMMDDSEPYALAQSSSELESQLALAVELGGISVWRHDLATGRMHYSTQGWAALGMAPRPEGLSLGEVRAMIHPEDLPAVLASAETAMRSPLPVDVEARYRHADGTWRPQMLRRTVLRDAQDKPIAFLGVALDITERLEQRRRADEMTRRFDTVTRAAGIGHWLLEPGQPSAIWSEQLRTMFGLAADAPVPALGDWLDRMVHPDDVHAVKEALRSCMDGHAESVELGFRTLRADGEVRQVFSHSRIENGPDGPLLFGVVIDITERRRSELALKSAEDRVALAARGAGLGTWELDMETGASHWDAQMWHLRGLEPRAGAPTDDERMSWVHPEDRERAHRVMHQSLAEGSTHEYEFRVVWPDGQVRWLASRSMQVQGANGHRSRIGVNWDISDKRNADTVRQEREIALRESASKSKFLARMSHELRTPLNAVLGFAQLLLADEAGSDAVAASRRRRLDHIRSAGQHLLTLINDVLDLSGLEGGELRIALHPVALQTLVDQTLPLLGPLQQAHQVRIELGPLDLHVLADATRLRQVLLNLLSNAVKYNRPNGTVRIDARQQGATVLLRVSDTGRGMSEQQLGHIFEPFNRLGADREAIEGSGIGLAIVKALVERMGGVVRVESRLGQGSVFELQLATSGPQAAAALTEPRPPEAPTPLPEGRRRCVLYVEDNPVNALIIGELMARRSDLVLHVAGDGASGVTQARTLLPDLILLDMQLPDFDGYEVLRRLRAQPQTAHIPCIALSANAMPEDIERALRAGMSDYWTKPLDFKAFMASLDVLFGKAP